MVSILLFSVQFLETQNKIRCNFATTQISHIDMGSKAISRPTIFLCSWKNPFRNFFSLVGFLQPFSSSNSFDQCCCSPNNSLVCRIIYSPFPLHYRGWINPAISDQPTDRPSGVLCCRLRGNYLPRAQYHTSIQTHLPVRRKAYAKLSQAKPFSFVCLIRFWSTL